jgi:hypothetical protein
MNQSLAAWMTCLLVGLLVAVTSKTGITYAYLSLLSTCWYFSRGDYCYTGVDRTGWKFTLDKRQWKGVQRQIEQSRWQRRRSLLNRENANTGKFRFSRFSEFQRAMRPSG